MVKSVKTTQIEKKFKDKQGNEKSLTIDYAKAADRIKAFREDCPNGVIETKPTFQDGKLLFTAFVKKDKAKDSSAEATGHALSQRVGDKDFEKTETIAVARALAMLGYLASGEVASSEEMQEFYEYKEQQIELAIDQVKNANDIDELKEIFLSLGNLLAEPKVIEAKNKRKEELQNEDKTIQD